MARSTLLPVGGLRVTLGLGLEYLSESNDNIRRQLQSTAGEHRAERERAMRQRKFNSQALRQLAEELLSQIAEEGAITAEEREDLTTALVRQWITYAGNATLLLGEQQVYLLLGRTPLGRPCVVPEPAL